MNKKYECVVEVKNVLDTIDTYDVSGIDTAIYSIKTLSSKCYRICSRSDERNFL